MKDYERLGGEEALRGHVQAYVDRFFDDWIIGFFFAGRDRAPIVERELELASAHLGGPHTYRGRGLAEVHRKLGIHRGHLRRRLAIVEHVLTERGVDAEIVERWLAFERRLGPLITDDRDCVE